MPYIQKVKINQTGDLSIIAIAKGNKFNESVGLTQTWSPDDVLNSNNCDLAFECGTIQVYSNWNILGDNLPADKTIGQDAILAYRSFIGKDPNNRCMDWELAQWIVKFFKSVEESKKTSTKLNEDVLIECMKQYHAIAKKKSSAATASTTTSTAPSAKSNQPHGMSLTDYKKSIQSVFDCGPIEPYFALKIPKNKKNQLVECRKRFVGFFKDADMTISRRLYDTVMRTAMKTGLFGAKQYIVGYLECIDHPMKDIIIPKLDSDEFKTALFDLISTFGVKDEPINKRFKIYYGEPSGGKTYQAISELKNKEYVIPCSSDITPDALMRDFSFNNGQPVFNQTLLAMAAHQGDTIVAEELRLLPQVTLCFLQNMLDNKDFFWYDNKKFYIHPDFKIIGTMNLVVNGHINPLPEALVDRAYEIKRFDITDDCYDVSYDFE